MDGLFEKILNNVKCYMFEHDICTNDRNCIN